MMHEHDVIPGQLYVYHDRGPSGLSVRQRIWLVLSTHGTCRANELFKCLCVSDTTRDGWVSMGHEVGSVWVYSVYVLAYHMERVA